MNATEPIATPAAPLAPRQAFGPDYGPLLSGPFAPVAQEMECLSLPVLKGRVPSDLNGIYLRTGPNPRFAPPGRYHPFDGDGMVHAVQFSHGQAHYRNRWVRTDAWQQEDTAGRALFHGIRDTLKGADERPLKDSGNTDLVAHRGRVLALWYMAGQAWELDPVSLRTLGPSAAILASGGAISAHAKVDEASEEMMFFDYGLRSPFMHYGVVGADGRLKHHVPISLPGPRLPHDMAVTARHTVLHDLPLFHCPQALALGRHKIEFHPELPLRLGVIPRFGRSEELRWFEFSPCFIYHVVNAWEEGDWLVMVGCRYLPAQDAGGGIDAVRTARDIAELRMRARLWRWRMNLRSGETEEQALDAQRNVEFPTFNSALTGRRTQWGYLCDQREDCVLQWPGIRKYDLFDGRMQAAWSEDPQRSWYSEPWFAAADQARAEDHGYVLSFHWHDGLQRQTLDIFDARQLGAGPLAQLALPQPVPVGFHGCWMAASRLRP